MEGDLSLSQSLGGLRIANPDDSPLQSSDNVMASIAETTPPAEPKRDPPSQPPSAPPALSSVPPPSAIPPTIPPSNDDEPTPFPSYVDNYSRPLDNRASIIQPPDSQTQPPQYAYAPSSHPTQSSRPTSNYFPNGSASLMLTREATYRIRTDSTASSASESQARVDSRGGSAALQAGVPVRDNSHSDRSYRSSKIIPGSSPMVMRQPSRAQRAAPTSQLSGSPYGAENGPLSSAEEWQDQGAAVSVRQDVDTNGKPVSRYIKKGVRDFTFAHTLGEGSYSTVVLATDRQTLKEYAIKILDKRHIIKEKKVKYVNIEKDTLNRLTDHPGIVRLYYTFQDEQSLYFVLDLCKGGELLTVLKRMSSFDEECTKFYGAQILDTIDYMHKRGVIHRDLKPENVLMDSQMHTKITDFGTAKILKPPRRPESLSTGMPPIDPTDVPEEDRASSFVGTAEYVSPELLNEKNACKASDLWAFGCIIYQLLAGRPPFKAGNEYQTFQKIIALDYDFPIGFPPVARDLVERLLVLDPARRLPIEHIKNHEFFGGITWGLDLWKRKAPRLKAYVPPPREPIKLNGGDVDSLPPSISTAPSNTTTSTRARPARLITDLPPPSQLDIEWSPVLSTSNERILKLANLTVISAPPPNSPTGNGEYEAPKKLSRFFGGSTTKKKQRLVMVTSSARVILAAAGGDEKKAKLDISLLTPGTNYRTATDSKGLSSWIVDTREKRFIFEDIKPSASDIGATALSAQEWLSTLDRAREMAIFQRGNEQYSATDEPFRELSSGLSSHANTLDRNSERIPEGAPPPGRTTLVKHQPTDSDSGKAKKRFSRRHSKNGLSAIF